MKQLQGPLTYLVIFALGTFVGSRFGGQSVNAYDRPVVAAESQTTNRQASILQKIGESAGSGEGLTDPFSLLQGKALITVQHKGDGPLSFRLVEERALGGRMDVGPSATLTGEFSSWKLVAQAKIDSPGRYMLKVAGLGDWKIAVSQ